MNHDPMSDALADIDPVRPRDLDGQARAAWAVAARDRIVESDRSSGERRERPRLITRRRLAGGAITVGALAGVAALSVAMWTGDGGQEDAAPVASAARVSALERSATANDRLPAWITRPLEGAIARMGVRTATIRHAGDIGERSLYVARRRGGGICLIDAVRDASARTKNPGGVNCQPAAVMNTTFLAQRLGPATTGAGITAVGVVPDGFTTVSSGARSATVASNIFVLDGVRPTDPVVAVGPTGQRVESVRPFGIRPPARRGSRLPVAMLAPNAPAGSRAIVAGDRLYSVSHRTSSNDIAVYRRRIQSDGSLVGDGMLSVAWPTTRTPLSLSTWYAIAPGRIGVATVIGIAPDGYTQVTIGGRSAPIRGNLIIVENIHFRPADGVIAAIVTGPSGTLKTPAVAMGGQSRARFRP